MKFTKRVMRTATAGVLLFGLNGCKPNTTPVANDKSPPVSVEQPAHGTVDHSVSGHSHGAGPHDGTIVDWGGGKYHVEFLVDHEQQQATVFILASDEKTPAPIKTESIQLSIVEPSTQVVLEAAPLESDPAGSASRFIGNHETFGVVQEYTGTITGVIDDTPYSGDFKEGASGGHAE